MEQESKYGLEMLIAQFNQAFEGFVKMVAGSFGAEVPELNDGVTYLEGYFGDNGYTATGIFRRLLKDMEPYKTEIQNKDYAFLLADAKKMNTKRNKKKKRGYHSGLVLFHQLGFHKLYDKLTKEEFDNFCLHAHNYIKICQLMQAVNVQENNSFDEVLKKIMVLTYEKKESLRDKPGKLNETLYAEIASSVLTKKGLVTDLLQGMQKMTIGNAAQMMSVLGIDPTTLKTMAEKTFSDYGGAGILEDKEAMSFLHDNIINPSAEMKSRTLGDLLSESEGSFALPPSSSTLPATATTPTTPASDKPEPVPSTSSASPPPTPTPTQKKHNPTNPTSRLTAAPPHFDKGHFQSMVNQFPMQSLIEQFKSNPAFAEQLASLSPTLNVVEQPRPTPSDP